VTTTLAPLPIEIDPAEIHDNSFGEYDHYQWIYRFPNGYGASVVWGTNGIYCDGRDGTPYDPAGSSYELAVLKYDGDESHLSYDTPITSDVLGWQTLQDVASVLVKVAAL
jgi:hypothetical protein